MDNTRLDDADIEAHMFEKWVNVAEQLLILIEKKGSVDVQSFASHCSMLKICSKDDIYSCYAASIKDKYIEHTDLLIEAWRRRMELDVLGGAIHRLSAGDEVDAVISSIERDREMYAGQLGDANKTRIDQANDLLQQIIDAKAGKIVRYNPSPFEKLNNLIGGFGCPTRFSVFGARPGMGKTTFLIQVAMNAANTGCPTVVFSLEMSTDEIYLKCIHQKTGISAYDLTQGKVTDSEIDNINETIAEIYDTPIFVEDSTFEIGKIRKKIRQYVRKHGVKLVIIDYLQLISDASNKYSNNRNNEVAQISRKIKMICQQEKVEVVALSQLSRSVETRGGDKRPMLSDLRDSGAIEQDANLIGFLYRPDYYQILEDSEGESLQGCTDILIVKQRGNNRGIGDVRLHYSKKYDKLSDHPWEYCPQEESYNAAIILPTRKSDDEDIPF